MSEKPDDMDDLLRRGVAGDEAALRTLFDRYRTRLKRMVRLRLSRRLQGRVDDLGLSKAVETSPTRQRGRSHP